MAIEATRRRPRLTIRAIMALVLVVALGLYLGIAAVEVGRAKEYHVHMAVNTVGPPGVTAMGGMQPPFWPRYARRVLGRPWRGLPLCGPTPGYAAEQCEFAHPEMAVRIGNQVTYQFSWVQAEKVAEIEAERKAR